MLRQFIKNNRPFAKTNKQYSIDKYLLEGCVEVPVLYEGNFIDAIWNGSEFIEGATPEEIEVKTIFDIKQKYEFHKSSGWEEYQNFRAKVVNDIYKQLITESEAFLIEENFNVAFNQISSTGDWKTARYKLLQVSNLPSFIQPYYDYAIQILNNYITNNYEN